MRQSQVSGNPTRTSALMSQASVTTFCLSGRHQKLSRKRQKCRENTENDAYIFKKADKTLQLDANAMK